MEQESISIGDHSEAASSSPARTRKRRGRAKASHSENNSKATLIPVTVQVPRDVVASYDQFSAVSGVNRQHLMREALLLYASMLGANIRIVQPQAATFVVDRAA